MTCALFILIGNVQASCSSLSYLPRPEHPLFLMPLISLEDSSSETSVYFSHRHQKPFFLIISLYLGFLHFSCTELPTWKKSATHVWQWRCTIATECTTTPCATLRRLAALPQSWHRWPSTADHSQTWVHFATHWGWMDWPWLCGASISLVVEKLLQWYYTFIWFLQNFP